VSPPACSHSRLCRDHTHPRSANQKRMYWTAYPDASLGSDSGSGAHTEFTAQFSVLRSSLSCTAYLLQALTTADVPLSWGHPRPTARRTVRRKSKSGASTSPGVRPPAVGASPGKRTGKKAAKPHAKSPKQLPAYKARSARAPTFAPGAIAVVPETTAVPAPPQPGACGPLPSDNEGSSARGAIEGGSRFVSGGPTNLGCTVQWLSAEAERRLHGAGGLYLRGVYVKCRDACDGEPLPPPLVHFHEVQPLSLDSIRCLLCWRVLRRFPAVRLTHRSSLPLPCTPPPASANQMLALLLPASSTDSAALPLEMKAAAASLAACHRTAAPTTADSVEASADLDGGGTLPSAVASAAAASTLLDSATMPAVSQCQNSLEVAALSSHLGTLSNEAVGDNEVPQHEAESRGDGSASLPLPNDRPLPGGALRAAAEALRARVIATAAAENDEAEWTPASDDDLAALMADLDARDSRCTEDAPTPIWRSTTREGVTGTPTGADGGDDEDLSLHSCTTRASATTQPHGTAPGATSASVPRVTGADMASEGSASTSTVRSSLPPLCPARAPPPPSSPSFTDSSAGPHTCSGNKATCSSAGSLSGARSEDAPAGLTISSCKNASTDTASGGPSNAVLPFQCSSADAIRADGLRSEGAAPDSDDAILAQALAASAEAPLRCVLEVRLAPPRRASVSTTAVAFDSTGGTAGAPNAGTGAGGAITATGNVEGEAGFGSNHAVAALTPCEAVSFAADADSGNDSPTDGFRDGLAACAAEEAAARSKHWQPAEGITASEVDANDDDNSAGDQTSSAHVPDSVPRPPPHRIRLPPLSSLPAPRETEGLSTDEAAAEAATEAKRVHDLLGKLAQAASAAAVVSATAANAAAPAAPLSSAISTPGTPHAAAATGLGAEDSGDSMPFAACSTPAGAGAATPELRSRSNTVVRCEVPPRAIAPPVQLAGTASRSASEENASAAAAPADTEVSSREESPTPPQHPCQPLPCAQPSPLPPSPLQAHRSAAASAAARLQLALAPLGATAAALAHPSDACTNTTAAAAASGSSMGATPPTEVVAYLDLWTKALAPLNSPCAKPCPTGGISAVPSAMAPTPIGAAVALAAVRANASPPAPAVCSALPTATCPAGPASPSPSSAAPSASASSVLAAPRAPEPASAVALSANGTSAVHAVPDAPPLATGCLPVLTPSLDPPPSPPSLLPADVLARTEAEFEALGVTLPPPPPTVHPHGAAGTCAVLAPSPPMAGLAEAIALLRHREQELRGAVAPGGGAGCTAAAEVDPERPEAAAREGGEQAYPAGTATHAHADTSAATTGVNGSGIEEAERPATYEGAREAAANADVARREAIALLQAEGIMWGACSTSSPKGTRSNEGTVSVGDAGISNARSGSGGDEKGRLAADLRDTLALARDLVELAAEAAREDADLGATEEPGPGEVTLADLRRLTRGGAPTSPRVAAPSYGLSREGVTPADTSPAPAQKSQPTSRAVSQVGATATAQQDSATVGAAVTTPPPGPSEAPGVADSGAGAVIDDFAGLERVCELAVDSSPTAPSCIEHPTDTACSNLAQANTDDGRDDRARPAAGMGHAQLECAMCHAAAVATGIAIPSGSNATAVPATTFMRATDTALRSRRLAEERANEASLLGGDDTLPTTLVGDPDGNISPDAHPGVLPAPPSPSHVPAPPSAGVSPGASSMLLPVTLLSPATAPALPLADHTRPVVPTPASVVPVGVCALVPSSPPTQAVPTTTPGAPAPTTHGCPSSNRVGVPTRTAAAPPSPPPSTPPPASSAQPASVAATSASVSPLVSAARATLHRLGEGPIAPVPTFVLSAEARPPPPSQPGRLLAAALRVVPLTNPAMAAQPLASSPPAIVSCPSGSASPDTAFTPPALVVTSHFVSATTYSPQHPPPQSSSSATPNALASRLRTAFGSGGQGPHSSFPAVSPAASTAIPLLDAPVPPPPERPLQTSSVGEAIAQGSGPAATLTGSAVRSFAANKRRRSRVRSARTAPAGSSASATSPAPGLPAPPINDAVRTEVPRSTPSTGQGPALPAFTKSAEINGNVLSSGTATSTGGCSSLAPPTSQAREARPASSIQAAASSPPPCTQPLAPTKSTLAPPVGPAHAAPSTAHPRESGYASSSSASLSPVQSSPATHGVASFDFFTAMSAPVVIGGSKPAFAVPAVAFSGVAAEAMGRQSSSPATASPGAPSTSTSFPAAITSPASAVSVPPTGSAGSPVVSSVVSTAAPPAVAEEGRYTQRRSRGRRRSRRGQRQ